MTPTPTTAPATPPALELRLPVDVSEAPLGYDDHGGTLAIEIALAGGGYANLVLPADGARAWAGELFGAVSVAHREATGDPHAVGDAELACLPVPEAYDPASTLALAGTEGCSARMRFVIALERRGPVPARRRATGRHRREPHPPVQHRPRRRHQRPAHRRHPT